LGLKAKYNDIRGGIMEGQEVYKMIIHEIQTTEGIHLSDASRAHVERLVKEGVRKQMISMNSHVNYWRRKYFECRNDEK
jgi:hypothetical protein